MSQAMAVLSLPGEPTIARFEYGPTPTHGNPCIRSSPTLPPFEACGFPATDIALSQHRRTEPRRYGFLRRTFTPVRPMPATLSRIPRMEVHLGCLPMRRRSGYGDFK